LDAWALESKSKHPMPDPNWFQDLNEGNF